MDRVGVSHQVGLVVEELPTDWTGQLGGSVQAGVLPQGGCHIQFNISDRNRKSFRKYSTVQYRIVQNSPV